MNRHDAGRQAALDSIAAGTGKGQRVADVKFEDAAALFGLTHEDRQKAMPGAVRAKLDDIAGTPTGKFKSRTAAESRAIALDKRLPKGTTIYAHQVGDHWCVIKASPAGRVILEG